MTAYTHVIIGVGAAASLAALTGHGDPWTAKAVAAVTLGSLAPDLDDPRSWLGRRLPMISWPLGGILGHRGLSHSLVAAVAASIGISFLVKSDNSFWLAFLVGYLGHLLADWNSNSGVPLFWPSSRRFRAPWAITTGGILEWAVGLVLSGFVCYQGFLALKGCGLWG